MPTETLDGYLDRMASGSATPGGGSAAAVQAGLAAALVAMAARCTPFERFPHAGLDTSDIARVADECRAEALRVATADEKAFAQVASAYRLPKDDEGQRRDRADSIQSAMENATKPPLEVLELTERIVGLAERLLPIANPNVLADLAAGVGAARAACEASRLTVEANVKSLGDPVVQSRLRSRMGDVDKTLERAHRLTEAVWGRVVR